MTTPAEAHRESAKYLREGCVRHGFWHDANGGKQIACKFGSLGRPANSPAACPADWDVPAWVWACVKELFEGQRTSSAIAWWARLADGANPLLLRASRLPPEAWSRIETRFKITTVRYAIAAAKPAAPGAKYWPPVAAAAQQVCDALEGGSNAAWAAAEDAARVAKAAVRRAGPANDANNAAWAAANATAKAANDAKAAAACTAANAAEAAKAAAKAALTAPWAALAALAAVCAAWAPWAALSAILVAANDPAAAPIPLGAVHAFNITMTFLTCLFLAFFADYAWNGAKDAWGNRAAAAAYAGLARALCDIIEAEIKRRAVAQELKKEDGHG